MAKKVVATLKQGKGKEYSLVIKSVRSPKSGAYSFKQEIVHNDHVKDYLEGKDPSLIKIIPQPKEEVVVVKEKHTKADKKEEKPVSAEKKEKVA